MSDLANGGPHPLSLRTGMEVIMKNTTTMINSLNLKLMEAVNI
jgi:hypothetical protein